MEEDPGGGIYQYQRPGGGTLPARWHEQNRWRPGVELPEVPGVKHERTKIALTEQCMNGRMPGYTGYKPSSRAEDICARSNATVGRAARDEQVRRHEMHRTMSEPSTLRIISEPSIDCNHRTAFTNEDAWLHLSARPQPSQEPRARRRPSKEMIMTGLGLDPGAMPDDHPLGKSKSTIVRNHWIPTIPGYSGYIPGVYPENISGGTMSRQVRMAARALAEAPVRGPPGCNSPVPDLTLPGPRGFKDKDNQEHADLVDHLRNHCSGHLPGYAGFIPRVHSETIFGATAANINRIAADMNEDRVLYPSDEGRRCHAVQVPDKRKLRM